MAKTAMIRARVDPDLKRRAEETLAEIGLTATTAISVFYSQIVARRGLPFDVRIPNAVTRRAMEDAVTGRNVVRTGSMDEMFAMLDDDASEVAPARTGRTHARH